MCAHIHVQATQVLVLYCYQYDHAHVSRLSERLVKGLMSQLDNVIRNGDERQSYPGGCDSSLLASLHG